MHPYDTLRRGLVLAVLACLLAVAGAPFAAAQSAAGGGPEPSEYSVALDATRLRGVVGEETVISMTLDPPLAPPGYFVTSLVSVRSAPDGPAPTILPGFPKATVVPRTAGRHVLDVRVNLVSKSSCGGVEVTTVHNSSVTLDAAPSGGQ